MEQAPQQPADQPAPASGIAQRTDARTIADFGEQWTAYTDNSGFYGSSELLADIFGPLLALEDVRNKRVADIGSGTGRIVNMLLDAGAAHVTAIEPSGAYDALCANTLDRAERVTLLRGRGEDIPLTTPFDLVVSVGVLHHVVDPHPIMRAALTALKPGGRMLVWLYAREGNERYLSVVEPLRRITRRLPHAMLAALCYVGDGVLMCHMALARLTKRWLKPSGYLEDVYSRLAADKRRLVIYDQLNPRHAHYYTRGEAMALMQANGFQAVSAHHRHGYSWTVIGERSA